MLKSDLAKQIFGDAQNYLRWAATHFMKTKDLEGCKTNHQQRELEDQCIWTTACSSPVVPMLFFPNAHQIYSTIVLLKTLQISKYIYMFVLYIVRTCYTIQKYELEDQLCVVLTKYTPLLCFSKLCADCSLAYRTLQNSEYCAIVLLCTVVC